MNLDQAFSLIKNDWLPRNKASTRWVDLGCGAGLFTHALSLLLQPGSSIYGIDTQPSLRRQTTANGVGLIPLQLNFVTDDWGLQDLDGVLMANSLHYVKDKTTFLSNITSYLNPRASFLVVEYDTDTPVSTWVPYPLSFSSLTALFTHAGYPSINKLGQRPSAYGRANMYAALIQPR
ncbi:MAG TPA: class I SAM-dependent methyltransferase [Puia sp.]|jgi:SAM-dependent methyltransferase|nr:class I SAM-dependent methyltransferase [Puia sp.]